MAGRRGRPKKYTAEAFRNAVEGYFASITAEEENERIVTVAGGPLKRIVYVVPPTVTGLCLALGIDRSTWQNYADPGKNGGKPDRPSAHSRICEDVKMRIEAYLNEQLLTREKSLQGVIFNLSNNFGWTERHEHRQQVELGEETRKAVMQNLTLDEKFALIREAAAEIAEAEVDPAEDEDGWEE